MVAGRRQDGVAHRWQALICDASGRFGELRAQVTLRPGGDSSVSAISVPVPPRLPVLLRVSVCTGGSI